MRERVRHNTLHSHDKAASFLEHVHNDFFATLVGVAENGARQAKITVYYAVSVESGNARAWEPDRYHEQEESS